MNILSIQSHVAYGHVGNSAAVFPLQRLGVEVWPVNTVQFSNHTGYGACAAALGGAAIRLLVQGIAERGVLGECDGVLSGYLGSLDTGEAVVDAVTQVKNANPAARYCCDPVIGDPSAAFSSAAASRNSSGSGCSRSPTPSRPINSSSAIWRDAAPPPWPTWRQRSTPCTPAGRASYSSPRWPWTTRRPTPSISWYRMLSGRWRLRCRGCPSSATAPAMPSPRCSSPITCARSAAEAMALAASAMYGVLSRTAEAGADEMLLVEAQDEFVAPSRMFVPQRISRRVPCDEIS